MHSAQRLLGDNGSPGGRTPLNMVELFIELLVKATALIPTVYFQLPVAGKEDPIYRERAYCYELYHRLRMLLEEEGRLAEYVLSGEIDKQGHPIIRACSPDFVFHAPGLMDNLVVVEVKPVNGALEGVQKDVETLAYFTSNPVGYRLGVLLIYGDDQEKFSRIEEAYRNAALERSRLLWHRRANEPASPQNPVIDRR